MAKNKNVKAIVKPSEDLVDRVKKTRRLATEVFMLYSVAQKIWSNSKIREYVLEVISFFM